MNIFKQTITMQSQIAMSPREWEQVKEYLEDCGFEKVELADAESLDTPTFQEREALRVCDELK